MLPQCRTYRTHTSCPRRHSRPHCHSPINPMDIEIELHDLSPPASPSPSRSPETRCRCPTASSNCDCDTDTHDTDNETPHASVNHPPRPRSNYHILSPHYQTTSPSPSPSPSAARTPHIGPYEQFNSSTLHSLGHTCVYGAYPRLRR